MPIDLKKMLRETLIFPIFKNIKKAIFNKVSPQYDRIFCDITNICNLRCPHCYNNWADEYLQKSLFMTMEHFEKIIPIASLASKGMFYLSCAFEPTLHPKFFEMLKKIPHNLQKQITFTTNLTTNISDNTFEKLSAMRIHAINISIESFVPEIYEQSRKNAKYDRFIGNLDRMVYFFKKEPKSPPIRFITLVTKLNAQEIPSIIEKCHTLYHAFENEIRYPWITPGPWNTSANFDWLNKFTLPLSDWKLFTASLKKVPFRFALIPPREDFGKDQENKKSDLKILWIRPDGVLRIEQEKSVNSFHIDSIANPIRFLKKKLLIL